MGKNKICLRCRRCGHRAKIWPEVQNEAKDENCPQNTHDIYPNGGCCRICGGVTHLAKNCPNKDRQGFVLLLALLVNQ